MFKYTDIYRKCYVSNEGILDIFKSKKEYIGPKYFANFIICNRDEYEDGMDAIEDGDWDDYRVNKYFDLVVYSGDYDEGLINQLLSYGEWYLEESESETEHERKIKTLWNGYNSFEKDILKIIETNLNPSILKKLTLPNGQTYEFQQEKGKSLKLTMNDLELLLGKGSKDDDARLLATYEHNKEQINKDPNTKKVLQEIYKALNVFLKEYNRVGELILKNCKEVKE